jgi:hypothetical protein
MRYPYHDMYHQHFEELVVEICAEILGPGVQPFSTGKDGGRDARFEGTAAVFPSPSAPLAGKFVIQAKHTEDPCAKFSDKSFSSDAATSVLSLEMPRIIRLVEREELEHYLLFSNRRLGGEADSEIRKRVKGESGAATVELFGIERTDSLLKRCPEISTRCQLSELRAPLRVTPDDLATVIVAIARDKALFETAREIHTYERVAFAKKNELNNLSVEFAKMIRKDYFKDFPSVEEFLANPVNSDLVERYQEAAREFHEQIVAHRQQADDLGRLLVNLQRLLFERDGDLARHKRLTKLVIYYMYWICDLGETAP